MTRTSFLALLTLSFVLGLSACGGAPAPASLEDLRSAHLDGLASTEIPAALGAFRRAAEGLVEAASANSRADDGAAFEGALGEANDAWKVVAPFVLGAARDRLLHERIDSLPNRARLEEILRAEAPLDAAAFGALGADLKGLRALAHATFLRGEGVAEPSRRAYLALAARDLLGSARALETLWSAEGEDLLERLAATGSEGGGWPDDKAAIDELVVRFVEVAVLFRDRDLAPLVGATSGRVVQTAGPEIDAEGWYRARLVSAAAALRDRYRGRDEASEAPSLSDLVRRASPRMDEAIVASLHDLHRLCEELPADLRAAIVSRDPRLQAAYDRSTLVRARLGTGMTATLKTTLGFTLSDGD